MSSRIIRGAVSGIKLDKRGLGEFYFEIAEEYDDKICQVSIILCSFSKKEKMQKSIQSTKIY